MLLKRTLKMVLLLVVGIATIAFGLDSCPCPSPAG